MQVCYYLQAVLMLKHLTKPSVTKNLMVKDWLEKKVSNSSDGQKATYISTSQNIIVLHDEDEHLFEIYFKFIRPTLLKKNSKMVNHFFVTLKGQPITNSGKDLERLHEKFQQPLVTAKEAKAVLTRWALEHLSEEDRELANTYINHSNQQEGITILNLINGMLIVTTLLGDGRGESSRYPVSKKRKRTAERIHQGEDGEDDEMEEERIPAGEQLDQKDECFKKLLEKYPIQLNEHVPSLTMCKSISQTTAQHCQDKWRRAQYKSRIEDVIEHFRHPPTKDQLAAYIDRQNWTSNIPRLQNVELFFRPHKIRGKEDNNNYKQHG
ncbi:uncharacterized protein ACNLHF_011811 isoform 1-T2 [Anomaloglossus baeobatrachus]|uniref:uncharacterized protein LOC142291179 n=1 Tax=Anomaloglossus baeobatrachus TaxID=238106 RepID=UPI003F4F469A